MKQNFATTALREAMAPAITWPSGIDKKTVEESFSSGVAAVAHVGGGGGGGSGRGGRKGGRRFQDA